MSLGLFLRIVSSDRLSDQMNAESKQERVRERWKLAKRVQRARQKITAGPVCPIFKEAVFAERDRRAKSAWGARRLINGVYLEVAGSRSSFVADVWAAKAMLIAKGGLHAATPTRIARYLWDEDMTNDYARSSLRPMVYRAIEIIKDLEAHGQDQNQPPFWGPSELMLDNHANNP